MKLPNGHFNDDCTFRRSNRTDDHVVNSIWDELLLASDASLHPFPGFFPSPSFLINANTTAHISGLSLHVPSRTREEQIANLSATLDTALAIVGREGDASTAVVGSLSASPSSLSSTGRNSGHRINTRLCRKRRYSSSSSFPSTMGGRNGSDNDTRPSN
jgi:hypothetical protein